MCDKRKIEEDPDRLVPCTVELSKLTTKEIIEAGRIETTGVDSIEIHENIRITEMELLVQRMHFSDELSSFYRYIHVHFHLIITLQDVSEMFQLLYPGKRISR